MAWEWGRMTFGTWKEKVQFELMEIRSHIEIIEAKLTDLGVISPETVEAKRLFGEMGARYAGYEPYTTEEEFRPETAYETLVLLSSVRRALYGYGMLLTELGLSKDQKKLVQELEHTMSMVIRLTQSINLIMIAVKAFETSTPYGIALLGISGGMFAASLAYGSKLGSSG